MEMNILLFLIGIFFLDDFIEGYKLLLCDSSTVKTFGHDTPIVLTKPPPSISNIFSYATVVISSDVEFQIKEWKETNYFSPFVKQSKTYVKEKLSCFKEYNISISFMGNPSDITVKILDKRFDKVSFMLFCIGCVLFINAKFFSRSATFMYASCASVGALASCLILLIIFYRIVPYKRIMAFLFTVGSGMWFYFLDHLQNIVGTLILNYPYQVISYLIFSALVSISLLYYFGIPSNDRTLNLLQWFMQLAAIYLIYFSCYNKTFPITVIVLLAIFQFISFSRTVSYLSSIILPKRVMLWFYPPMQPRFLTLEEYEQQRKEETERALKELQQYCSSPKCNSWEVVSRLKDPKRFARFLSSGDQFTKEEVDEYYIEEEEEEEEEESFEFASDQYTTNQDGPRNHQTRIMDQREMTEWISDDERANSTLLTD